MLWLVGIVVLDLDVLPGHHADHVRLVHAAVLFQRRRGWWAPATACRGKPGFHPHKRVLQRAVVVDHHFFDLLRRACGRVAQPGWPTCRCVFIVGFVAGEAHFAGDGGAVRFIRHGRRAAGRRRRGSLTLGRLRRFARRRSPPEQQRQPANAAPIQIFFILSVTLSSGHLNYDPALLRPRWPASATSSSGVNWNM